METLLVFLAIAVIQLIASYSKQKKEAAKKAAKKSVPPPQATQPIPDPFREIREAMGFPPAEEREEIVLEEKPKPYFKEEGVAPIKNLPFQSIVNRKRVAEEDHVKYAQEILPERRKLKIDASKLSQGILWTAILQEPRYKKKWKPLNR